MAHEIDVMCEEIEEPSWIHNVEQFASSVMQQRGYTDWSFSIVFCNDSHIKKLNLEFRNKDSATDVLSFTQIDSVSELPSEGVFYAGDILISLETLAENARYFEVDEEEELKRLIIHGILHLGGWDHSDNSPQQEMLQLQESILMDLREEKIY